MAAWCSARPRCWAAKSGSRIHGGSSRLGLDFGNQEIASATARGQLAYYELLDAGACCV